MLAVAVGCTSCLPETPSGWQAVGQDNWEWWNRGELWVRGLPANGALPLESESDQVIRFDLVNLGEQKARVVLNDSKVQEWEIEPGQVQSVELEGLDGQSRFEAPDDVAIAAPRRGRGLDESKLIVVIVVDTLRADHVTPEIMPGITEYFAAGFKWSQATANAPWTLPSVASYFTSRPVLDLTSPSGDLIGVPNGIRTWPQELEAGGFTGAAMVANYTVSVLNGYGKGFSTYLVPDGHGGGEKPDANWIVDHARRWMSRHEGEDAFLYLHFMDPHFPYRDHDGSGRTAPNLPALEQGRHSEAEGERELLEDLYAGEVRHVDRVLAPFLRELPENAFVVFTSDHGESLGERDCWGHGINLYQESIHVPLLIRGPGLSPGGSDTPVQLLDLAPTVLGAAGVPTAPEMAGRSLLEGGSDHPIISSTFAAGPLRWVWRRGGEKVLMRMAEQPGLGEVARSKMAGSGPRAAGVFVYDLIADPAEEDPRGLSAADVDPVIDVFGRSAGRMVPGLQIGLSQRQGEISTSLTIAGEVEVIQAWGAAPIRVVRTGDQLQVRCEDAFPVCVLATRVNPVPSVVFAGSQAHSLDDRGPPTSFSEGLSLWWNPPRPLVVDGYDETVERLRALGYIE